jgi:prepilin-type N-terminal cleavage/methylation domain-containing protein
MKTTVKYLNGPAKAFTLIEIMIVVGIMGIILAIGIPSIVPVLKKQGMRKAVEDVLEVCRNARARAIFKGVQTEVMFYPLEGRFNIVGASVPEGDTPSNNAQSGTSGKIPDTITIEMLDINLQEYRESEWCRVRFHPNGTSDEMTLILCSDKGDRRKIKIEVTTGLAVAGPLK